MDPRVKPKGDKKMCLDHGTLLKSIHSLWIETYDCGVKPLSSSATCGAESVDIMPTT